MARSPRTLRNLRPALLSVHEGPSFASNLSYVWLLRDPGPPRPTPTNLPMSRPPLTSSAESAPVSGVRAEDELDPELLALPDPPRAERTVTLFVLAFTAIAALA